MTEPFRHHHRVTYAECTVGDHVYHSRYLDLLEAARGELLRALGCPVLAWQDAGYIFPVIEAHLRYKAPARYDDLLRMTSRGSLVGRARVRVDNSIVHAATGAPVARGYTVHAIVDPTGKPIRPPAWLLEVFSA